MEPSIWDTNQSNQANPITGLPYSNDQLATKYSIWGESGNPYGQQNTQGIAGIQGTSMDDLNTTQNNSFWNAGTFDSISQGLGAIGSIGQTYLGFQQLGQAEDQLAFQKEAFWTNYNQQVADREEAARRRTIASTGEDPTA